MRARRSRRYSVKSASSYSGSGIFGRMKRRFLYLSARFRRYSGRRRLVVFSAAGVLVVTAVLLVVFLSGNAPAVSPMNGSAALVNAGDFMPPASETSSALPSAAPSPTPIPTPEPTPTPTPDPTLKKGDENERVQELQNRLMDLGYLDVDETRSCSDRLPNMRCSCFSVSMSWSRTVSRDQIRCRRYFPTTRRNTRCCRARAARMWTAFSASWWTSGI